MSVDEQLRPTDAGARGSAEPLARRLRDHMNTLSAFGSIVILALLMLVFSLTSNAFLVGDNIKGILVVQTIVACLTLGTIFPLIVAEFDLSIGFSVGTLSMLTAYLARDGRNAAEIIVIVLAAGAVIGLVNGILVEFAKISSFVATLAVGTVLQGVTYGLSKGSVLSENTPHFILTVGSGYAGPLAIAVWITLGLAIVLFYILEHTPFGRSLYAVGGSVRVSFLAGLRTRRLKIWSFVICGLFVALAAMFAVGQNGSASPSFGPDLLLPAYAAAFLGVTTFRPGYYNVVGSIVGILLLAIGFNGLSLWGAPFWVQPMFNGGVLILAVLTGRAESRRVRIGT